MNFACHIGKVAGDVVSIDEWFSSVCLIGVTLVGWLELCELRSMDHLGGRLGRVPNPASVHAIKVEGRMQILVLTSPSI